ncbi:MAG TPA: glycine cleavage system protein GcvH [Verrucomicrobiales bacterium]|jgi:glycine cleavage system H protein|nr:glycine cleavage system protein GcvH [Verrucomicrobiales bacterium]HAW01529.1 glycine cleavage system protein GcvH [Verrucomicrobiales bacterium]HBP54873.1 glycine cleavage system protein GcvH [Verrucomicrobiales bacterium]HCP36437.1 glycine cleavage system protein GcvH [Verrucomicrobiales bacterium]HCZ03899.1 glycine cleavage system protein GcvH [Verrucomicrobiales bacterium]|tara:strand:+ start:1943 stop:2329 length:387 start_codon:yes stop_codon:yes gene_type:complete
MSSLVPDHLKYAKTHEWVKVEGDTATIGITDHAQAELTELVFVELPAISRNLKAGEACAVVESVKTASDIYSPVTGEVIEVNEALVDNPGSVNTDAYSDGWFFKMRLSDPGNLDELMSAEEYKVLIGS